MVRLGRFARFSSRGIRAEEDKVNRASSVVGSLNIPALRRRLALVFLPLLVLTGVALQTRRAEGAHASSGYWMLTADGHVYNFGGAAKLGEPSEHNNVHVDIEPTPSGHGFWVLRAGGAVTLFGDAAELDSGPKLPTGERYVSLSATPAGDGYWLFTSKGAAHAIGAAKSLGDMAQTALNSPVIDSVATPSGNGYWMVAGDGGIFNFGDAKFAGSMGNTPLNQPVISMAPDPDGSGYWLVASDGGIFAFSAPFHGSMGSTKLNKPVSGMVGGADGYLMVAEDGGSFAFGKTDFHGSLGANPPSSRVVSVAVIGKPRPNIVILPADPGPTTTTTQPPVLDTTPPDTTITAGPAEGSTVGPLNDFEFSSSEAGSTFECSSDGVNFGACTSGTDVTHPDGPATFYVRARDAAGNVDPTPATRSFTVDDIGPDATITSPTTAENVSPTPTYIFASDGDAIRFECFVDDDPPFACNSGGTLATLDPGQHTLTVSAYDEFDNVGVPGIVTFNVV